MTLFHRRGAHILVDGQFGSTGKGLLAAWVAEHHGSSFDVVVTNAGPNSGHTFYVGDEKVVLKQLPSLPVYHYKKNRVVIPTFLSAGSLIDPDILNKEVSEHGLPVFLSAQATIIRPEHKAAEQTGPIAAVAGTRQGVGAALADKISRKMGSTVETSPDIRWHDLIRVIPNTPDWRNLRIFGEVSQGFSLGINSGFFPKVTSRECTAMQLLADARIPASFFTSAAMVIRTFPIRVGDVDGFSSGAWYEDQEETTWDRIGVQHETTTVTGRVRRVATFSAKQVSEAAIANQPRLVLLNFMNYLSGRSARVMFANRVRGILKDALSYSPEMLYGFGPNVEHISSNPEGV